ncbi:MAG: PAS domain-containing protein [Candidatus Eisenbacteria bacterium]|nr:PAS domain-containing protein [Candidatus Eisenbacteria bacterium]
MAITTENVFRLFDVSFDYLLVLDDGERVVHVSNMLARQCRLDRDGLIGRTLADILPPTPLEEFRRVLSRVRESESREVAFWKVCDRIPSIPLKGVSAETEDGVLYLFWGNRLAELDGLEGMTDWDKVERIKELSCLYAVAEWIEVSGSVAEFFEKFPEFMREGMKYPDRVAVFSSFLGREYGDRPEGLTIKSNLVVGNEVRGEIVVGYDTPDLEMLPEEQKLLNGITRILGVALDRKELADTLAAKREEMENQRRHLDKINSYLDGVVTGFEESKIRLETMFQAIPDKVAIIDRERNVIMTNREEVPPGSKCHKTFFDSDRPCLDCRLARIVREKAPITLEIRHDDNYYEVHALPIFGKDHDVNGIIEFYRDVTYKKTYEQQLQQADKLASLGQLVSGIGHEINNPNQFIRGNIKIFQQAMEDILPIVDEYQKSHPDLKVARLKYDFFRSHIMTLIQDMANGSERIKRIVEGLKRFARRDEGLLIDNVDVNTVINESARLVHNQVHKAADIELEPQREIPTFTGNAQKIEQVLINLIINASQAMPEDRRGLIRLITRSDEDFITIEVQDNGKGMGERTLNQIFDPFYTTKRAKGGTGLGLSIAYRIIEEHRGSISVSSKPDVGTTFTIRIPYKKKKADAAGKTDEEAADR